MKVWLSVGINSSGVKRGAVFAVEKHHTEV